MPWPHWPIAAARRCIMRLPILLTIVAVKRAGRPSRYSRISAICWTGDFQLHGGSRLGGTRGCRTGIRTANGSFLGLKVLEGFGVSAPPLAAAPEKFLRGRTAERRPQVGRRGGLRGRGGAPV